MSLLAPFKAQRTTGVATLFSAAMHAVLLVGFAQHSTRSPAEQHILEKQPIAAMLVAAPMRTVDAPVATSAATPTTPSPAERKTVAAQASVQAATPAPSMDPHLVPKPLGDIAKAAGLGATPAETPDLASKADSGAGNSSLTHAHLTAASVQPVEKRPDPEPAQGARPDYAYSPQPDYPMLLREQGVGGVVWLRVWVDSEGRPVEIKLAKGSGYRLLDDAALRAVRQWKFIPARNGEQGLASWVEFPIRFTLNG